MPPHEITLCECGGIAPAKPPLPLGTVSVRLWHPLNRLRAVVGGSDSSRVGHFAHRTLALQCF